MHLDNIRAYHVCRMQDVEVVPFYNFVSFYLF